MDWKKLLAFLPLMVLSSCAKYAVNPATVDDFTIRYREQHGMFGGPCMVIRANREATLTLEHGVFQSTIPEADLAALLRAVLDERFAAFEDPNSRTVTDPSTASFVLENSSINVGNGFSLYFKENWPPPVTKAHGIVTSLITSMQDERPLLGASLEVFHKGRKDDGFMVDLRIINSGKLALHTTPGSVVHVRLKGQDTWVNANPVNLPGFTLNAEESFTKRVWVSGESLDGMPTCSTAYWEGMVSDDDGRWETRLRLRDSYMP